MLGISGFQQRARRRAVCCPRRASRLRSVLPGRLNTAPSEGGFTLVEAVVSLALITIVLLVLAAGLLTAARSSASAQATQKVDGAVSAYAESFKGQWVVPPASGCPDYDSLATPVPVWFTGLVTAKRVVRVESWTGGAWNAACPSPAGTYRLTVEVTVDGDEGPQSRQAQVVVRRP